MLVLKICCSEWKNESRDKRELSVCRELGMDVVVLAKGKPSDKGTLDSVAGFDVRRYSTRPLGKIVPNSINRIIALFMWAGYAKKLSPDVISGHDIQGLTIAWMSNLFKPQNTKAKLVYDSHEFEIERNANRTKFLIWTIKHWERFLIKRCAFSIMVCDSIADEVQKIHNLKDRPIVVRNIPNLWEIDEKIIKEKRNEIIEKFGGGGIEFIVMYHGAISKGRGIEDIIKALTLLPKVGLYILGDCKDKKYMSSLTKLIEELKVGKQVIFHDSVDITELWKYVGIADLGCCNNEKKRFKSYYLGLPNKLFENIQCEVPVLISNRPEMRRIVEEYKVGVVCYGEEFSDYAEVIKNYIENIKLQKTCKEYLKVAKHSLCWENECIILKNAYNNIISKDNVNG